MTQEEIGAVLDDNALSLTRTVTENNPFMPGEKKDLEHFYCTLSGPAIEPFEFYFSRSPGQEPDDATVISLLMKDIKTYRGCGGYEDFLRVFKLNDDEDRAELVIAWEELARLAPLVEQVAALGKANEPIAPSTGMGI